MCGFLEHYDLWYVFHYGLLYAWILMTHDGKLLLWSLVNWWHCCVIRIIMNGPIYMYYASYARQKDANAHVILPGAHRSARHMRRTFDTCFTLSLIYHLYVLFVWISYQARFGLKISYPAIVFTMVIGLLYCGSFIVHILLLGTSKVFTLSVFLPCACVHVLLPGTRRMVETCSLLSMYEHVVLQHHTIFIMNP